MLLIKWYGYIKNSITLDTVSILRNSKSGSKRELLNLSKWFRKLPIILMRGFCGNSDRQIYNIYKEEDRK